MAGEKYIVRGKIVKNLALKLIDIVDQYSDDVQDLSLAEVEAALMKLHSIAVLAGSNKKKDLKAQLDVTEISPIQPKDTPYA